MIGATVHLQKEAQEIMSQKPPWMTYLTGQMITKDDYDFMHHFDQLNADGRAKFLMDPNNRSQVRFHTSMKCHWKSMDSIFSVQKHFYTWLPKYSKYKHFNTRWHLSINSYAWVVQDEIYLILIKILQEDKSRVEIFNTYAKMKKEQIWSYFFNMFSNPNQFVVYQVETDENNGSVRNEPHFIW